MMTETEVIAKLKEFKEALTRFKNENIELKQNAVDLAESYEKLRANYENLASLSSDEANDLRKDIATLESLLADKNKQILELEVKLKGNTFGDEVAQITADVDKIVSSNMLSEAERRYEEMTNTKQKEIETKKYRFGRTSEAVKNQFEVFLNGLFNGAQFIDDAWQLRTIEDAALLSEIDSHMLEVFMNRVQSVKYKGKKLIYRNPQGVLVSPFDKEFVVNYLCEEEE